MTDPRPLRLERKPTISLAKIEDQTGGVDVYSFAAGGARLLLPLSPPMVETLQKALTLELGRLDVPIVATPEQADATLSVRATEARMEGGGSLSLSLTLKSRDGLPLWSKRIRGQSPGEGSLDSVMSNALADAMTQVGSLFESDNVASLILAGAATPRPAPDPGNPPQQSVQERISDIDDLPANRGLTRPNAHAVVIGISGYRQKLPAAGFADSDARLVSRYLTQVLGYQDENVATLINEHASKSDLEKYFDRWLPNRVEDNDEVFVFYAGHGAPNPTTGEANMVPYDGDPTYLKQTGYPAARLYAALARLPARKITVVLDAGFSGAGERSVLAKGAKPLVVTASEEDIPSKMAILSASAADQAIRDYEEKGHGLFTYFFLKGVKEKSVNGNVNLRSVFDYAADQVSKTARRDYNADQVPQWRGANP
ncbi:MAG: caspase family protein [Elusimicrobia bacterium]|nr:caspase family protein [Elusimicrobiota bacterium]